MRSDGKDIVELFGFAPDDIGKIAKDYFSNQKCPFIGSKCTKTNHDQTIVYGTCSVSGVKLETGREEIIICPKRLYANNYRIFADVISLVWGDVPLVIGGSIDELRLKALEKEQCIIAFGQNSGKEVSLNSNGKISMDWVLQRYIRKGNHLTSEDFVGIEIQSIDITGNYRHTFDAYAAFKNGAPPPFIPKSGHGLNWANVHKRLIPQIIRKGNIYRQISRCSGFFFILPDQVYGKFDEVLGEIDEENSSSRHNLSVLTYTLGRNVATGEIRPLVQRKTKHHAIANIALAFSENTAADAPDTLDNLLKKIL